MKEVLENLIQTSRTKHEAYIKYAIYLGYTFDFNTGEVVYPSGKRKKPQLYKSQKYPCITFNKRYGKENTSGSKVISFMIHKFAAYILYGADALDVAVNVRHLNGNVLDLSKDNIALGTSQQNQFDKSQEVRANAAIKARASQGIRPVTSVVKDEQVLFILAEYFKKKGSNVRAPIGTVKELSVKYGVSRGSIQAICIGRSFKDIYQQFINKKDLHND